MYKSLSAALLATTLIAAPAMAQSNTSASPQASQPQATGQQQQSSGQTGGSTADREQSTQTGQAMDGARSAELQITQDKVVDTLTHGYNFQAQLMSGNPGIGEEGHLAQIAGKVGSADAHTVSADQCLSRARSRRVGEIDHRDDLWLGEFNCFHGI